MNLCFFIKKWWGLHILCIALLGIFHLYPNFYKATHGETFGSWASYAFCDCWLVMNEPVIVMQAVGLYIFDYQYFILKSYRSEEKKVLLKIKQ